MLSDKLSALQRESLRVIKSKENSTYGEVFDTYHNRTNQEESDLIIIAICLGGGGQKLSIPKENKRKCLL
jgi:hypothetical protein